MAKKVGVLQEVTSSDPRTRADLSVLPHTNTAISTFKSAPELLRLFASPNEGADFTQLLVSSSKLGAGLNVLNTKGDQQVKIGLLVFSHILPKSVTLRERGEGKGKKGEEHKSL